MWLFEMRGSWVLYNNVLDIIIYVCIYNIYICIICASMKMAQLNERLSNLDEI